MRENAGPSSGCFKKKRRTHSRLYEGLGNNDVNPSLLRPFPFLHLDVGNESHEVSEDTRFNEVGGGFRFRKRIEMENIL